LVETGCEDAILCFRQAFKIDPNCWNTACKVGALLRQQNWLEEALACFDACDRPQPDQASTLQLRAIVFYGLKRFEKAPTDNRRANELDPENPRIRNNDLSESWATRAGVVVV
jgi:Flp pilus assembly protein TadD